MKTLLRLTAMLTVLVALFAATVGTSGAAPPAGAPPTSAAFDNGAYVILGQPPGASGLHFRYGWRTSSQFYAPAAGYWLGLYDITRSTYVWAGDNPFPVVVAPGSVTTDAVDFHYSDPSSSLLPGKYAVNFFVRDGYPATSNVAEISLEFVVP